MSNDNNKHRRRRIALTAGALFLVGSGIIIIILPMTDAAFAAIIGTAAAAAPSSTPAECVTGQAGEMRMVTVTEMPDWVRSTPDFVRYFLESNYYNNMCGSEKNKIETLTPFFVMLRDGDQEPDDLQQQENIYLVEFSAEYKDVGERCETAIFFYEDHDDSKYGYVLLGDALKDLIEIHN